MDGAPAPGRVSPSAVTSSFVSGATTSNLTITDVSNQDVGNYFVVLTTASGSDSSAVVQLSLPTPDAVENGIPQTQFSSLGPNPSIGRTTARFSLAHGAMVQVQVHDIAGRLVRQLVLGHLEAGMHQTTWDSRIDDQWRAAIGLYFVTLEVDGHRVGERRLIMLH